MTPKQVLAMIKEKGVVMVDVKFIDLLGTWQHFTAPISESKDEAPFDEGLGFDGSSIRGWQAIDNSDMLVIPDPDTAVMDPFTKDPTLSIIANISDPITRADYTRDPRNISRKAEAYLKTTGVGDAAFFGPEPEFFIFDSLRYDTTQNSSYYYIDSNEGNWTAGARARSRKARTLASRSRTRPAISRSHRWTLCRTSAPRWCSRWSGLVSASRSSITKSRRRARPKSTCAFRP